jgi:ABC-type nitrate/sulfonate/bicarbonate transport system permease component
MSRVVQAGFVVALLVLWYLATELWGVSALLLPKPGAVLRELVDVLRTGEFAADLRVTLGELAAAFALAVTGGTVLGYSISRSSYWTRVVEPLVSAIYAIPIILFLPLYVLFFGLGPASKIALGATIGFFPVALSTVAGFAGVERTYIVALPVILAGLRMGFTVALLSILGAETLSSVSGLGHRIVSLGENMDMARMFAYIAFVVAIAVSLNAIVSWAEARGRRA